MLIYAIWSAARAVEFQLNFEMHCTVSISDISSARCFMCRIKMAFVMFYCLQIDTMWDTKGLLAMQAHSFHRFQSWPYWRNDHAPTYFWKISMVNTVPPFSLRSWILQADNDYLKTEWMEAMQVRCQTAQTAPHLTVSS